MVDGESELASYNNNNNDDDDDDDDMYVCYVQGRIYLLVGPRPNSSVGHSCVTN